MNQILFVKKQDIQDTLTTNEIIRLFEDSEMLDQIKDAVEKAEDRLLVTWATVEMKDKAGELIPVEDVISQQDTLLKRNGPITDTHTNKIIGQTLAYKVMEHPETKSTGILHLDKIFDDNQLDDKVWGQIQSGEKTGSSVGGFNTGLSSKIDNVTGEKAKVLEGFNHIETSMVDDPCNPMALNEAFSIVAKSNNHKEVKKGELADTIRNLPDELFDKIEKNIVEALEKTEKKETDINKDDLPNGINTEDNTMSNEILKSISDLTGVVKDLSVEVAKIKKQDVPEEKPEEEKPEEKKKAVDDDDEEKKKVAKEDEDEKPSEEEKKKVKKEEAKSDIDGETPAPAPESPVVEDSNDKDVFKKEDIVKLSEQVSDLQKQVTQVVEKSVTPSPGTPQHVNKKAQAFSELPMELAMGKKKMGMFEVNKVNDEYLDSMEVQ